jgi:hypothetical protein
MKLEDFYEKVCNLTNQIFCWCESL